jgi:hypothetical protein
LSVNDVPQVGFYICNDEEMKIVEWIMRTFVKYASYKKVLEECESTGVKNKTGQPFLRNSLITLLTNTKYIGKWEVNAKNKTERQDKLMAYDRHAKVDLPHGCVIDAKLWEAVQQTVSRIAGNKAKVSVRRVNPLVGVLRFKDGSTFGGTGAWGKTCRSNYYYNKKHNIRLKAEPLEQIAVDTVAKLIDDSPELREAMRRRGTQTTSALQLLAGEIEKQRASLLEIQKRQDSWDLRLDFLLKGQQILDAESVRKEYSAERTKLKAEREAVEHTMGRLIGQKRDLEQDSFDWKTLGGNAKRALALVAEHDPVALKNAYSCLFEAVVVGELSENGARGLEFVIREGGSAVIPEEKSSFVENLG